MATTVKVKRSGVRAHTKSVVARSLDHAASSPVTKYAVAAIHADMASAGRNPLVRRRRAAAA